MKVKSLFLGLMLLTVGSAQAAPFRTLQCTILGCTDGEVRMTESFGQWTFEFYEKYYLTNPLLDELTDFLRVTGRVGVNDRVDHWRFEMNKTDCLEARGIGNFLCRGKAVWSEARVRENERYDEGEAGYDFTWKTIAPSADKPWTVEIRKLTEKGETQWFMVLSDGANTHEFRSVPLYSCRENEQGRGR